MAMLLFSIAMLAIIPALTQAGRNMAHAQWAYAGHLQAQRLMLAARDALDNGQCPIAAASQHANAPFSLWIYGANTVEFHCQDAPEAENTVTGVTAAMANNASTIIVIVWGEDGQVAGRAIGMHYPRIIN